MKVIIEKVEGTIAKTTEPNNQERPEVKHLLRQPRRTTLIKTTVGQKEVPNQNTKKPEHTIDSPVFANRLASIRLPHKFKPSNHSKYDGKTEPR